MACKKCCAFFRISYAVRGLLLVSGLTALALLGCQNEEIRRYTVPKAEKPKPAEDRRAGDVSPPLPQQTDLTYLVPEGWEKQPPGTFARVAFRVTEGGQSATTTVTSFPGLAGGLKANVDRWRSQIGLAPLKDEEELWKELQPLEVAGTKAHYVDLIGPRERILGVILPRGDQTWFFKMQGSTELVGKQKPAFEKFVKSVQFDKQPKDSDG